MWQCCQLAYLTAKRMQIWHILKEFTPSLPSYSQIEILRLGYVKLLILFFFFFPHLEKLATLPLDVFGISSLCPGTSEGECLPSFFGLQHSALPSFLPSFFP